MVTVFTPVYNRAYIIENLFNSLLRQTNQNFEWIIVDDGSTDNLQQLVNEWKENSKPLFSIDYYYQENGGKHRAINRAVKLAKGDAFFIVDSDDYLTDDAIEKILIWWEDIQNDKKFAGVSGLKCYKDRKVVGGLPLFQGYVDATNFEREQYGLLYDKAEVYKTEVLKQFPFPEFENENFVTEGMVWDKIAYYGYKIRWYSESIYICDYIEDGLTRQGRTLFLKNPKGYGAYLQQSSKYMKWTKERKYFEYYIFYSEYISYYPEQKFQFYSYLGLNEEEVSELYSFHEKSIDNTLQVIGNTIALYGLGARGKRILEFYKDTCIKIEYGIDKKSSDVSCHQISILEDLPKVGTIIVTPQREQQEIINMLRKKTDNCLTTYEEWLKEVIGG